MTKPIIIALDVETAAQAQDIIETLGDSVNFYKVGMELYAAEGPDLVREILVQGKKVFLDLKLYDIGETVRRAVAQVAKLGVQFLTVHAVRSVMEAAVEGRGDSDLKILGVTVLTSFNEADLIDEGYSCSVPELVSRRVKSAMKTGVDGLVCSPLEVASVRRQTGPKTILVTPGVRSAGIDSGDQKRVATPAAALRDGANYLVVGRQVTRAHDPKLEIEKILGEIDTSSAAFSGI